MATQTVDYTTWRVGRVVERGTYRGRAWTHKIVRCPKCGRRGMERPGHHDAAGRGYPAQVYHVVEQSNSPFPMQLVREMCVIAGSAPADEPRYTESRRGAGRRA